MRILTFNIAGNRGRRKLDYLKRVADYILESEADIVGLQEVIHHEDDHHAPDLELARLTGFDCSFAPAHRLKDHSIGNAILSSRPIVDSVTHDLPHSNPERRIILEVHTCTHDGLPITAFCTHLVHLGRFARRVRTAQIAAVVRAMSTCWRPHFVVGDLNAGANAPELAALRNHSGPGDHHTGLSSWPVRRPLVLYDQIWPGPGWQVEHIEVRDTRLSDHRPVFARLAWRGAPGYNVAPDPPAEISEDAEPQPAAT